MSATLGRVRWSFLPAAAQSPGRYGKDTETRAAAPRSSVNDFVQRLLIETYAPASVLVNRNHQGLYYYGATDLYLKMPTGVGTLDLLASAREGLRPAIRAAFDRVGRGTGTGGRHRRVRKS